MNRESRRNILLGCATDYSTGQILPFVASLHDITCKGQIGLVIYEDQWAEVAPLATPFAITLLPVTRHPRVLPDVMRRRLQNRGCMRRIHVRLSRVLPAVCGHPSVLGARLWAM